MIERFMQYFLNKERLFNLMTYQVISTKEINDVVKQMQQECDNHNIVLLDHYVYHEIVKEKGFPIDRKAYIYEVCQAKVAAKVLTDEPDFAPFMPCRIAIYEKDDYVVISTQNMKMMLDTLKANKELYKETSTVFKTLKSLMSALK